MVRLAKRGIADALGCVIAAGLFAAPAHAQQPTAAPEKFDVVAFDVAGVTKLAPEVVEAAVYPYAGPGRSSADIEGARKALEDAYKAGGYESALVEIPPQPNETFVEGIVQLKVTEASIGKLTVTGVKHHSAQTILRQVPSLKEGEMPDLRRAQAELAAANRYPDRYITPSIKAGAAPGTIDVELKVDDSAPYHASAEVNNDHSASTSELRVAGSVRYTDLFRQGTTLAASYLISPQEPSESQVFSASYTAPIMGSDWTVLSYGYISNSNVASLGGTNVLGDGYSVGARLIYRIPSEAAYQSVSFGIDYKDFDETIVIPGANPGETVSQKTPLKYAPLVANYSGQIAADTYTANLTLGATIGLRGLGAGDVPNSFKRFDAVENFLHVNVDGDYTQSFKGDFVAFVRLSAQLADSPLYTNEQFAVGGASSVRGYFQSEAVGDDGLNTSIELRSPSIAPYIAPFIDEWRFFVFSDTGFTHIRRPLPDQQSEFRLLSVGAGTRIQLLKYITGNLAFGLALRGGPNTDKGDGQASFSVKAEF